MFPSLALLLSLATSGTDPEMTVSAARTTETGWRVHDVVSPFQSGTTEIHVLLPEERAPLQRLPVIYVLPVEAGRELRYGDATTEISKLAPSVRSQALFVTPTFTQLPWYADHPTDADIRQESHLLRCVLPFIERTYPAQPGRAGRRLLGFSKSGWGAWSLLLRHPQVFERAAAWDAPLLLAAPGKYGSGPIFGDQPNFEQYQISRLVRERAAELSGPPRLILLGYGNFRDEHVGMHAFLEELHVPHLYRDGPQREHTWHTGWVEEAVRELLAQP